MNLPNPTGDPIPHDFTALLCVDAPELLKSLSDPLEKLGFSVQPAGTVQEATTQLHSQPYDVVVMSETFCGADAETHPILSELAEIPLDLRRTMFVVLTGPNRSAFAPEMETFALSVDLFLGPQDLPNLTGLLARGLARHEAFYAAYHAAARRLGKEA